MTLVLTFTSGDSEHVPVASATNGLAVVRELRRTVTTLKSYYITDSSGCVVNSGEF